MTRQKKQAIYGAVYILPSFVLMMFFTFIPIFMTMYFSFTKYNLGQPAVWIGLENYENHDYHRMYIGEIVKVLVK